MKKFVLFSIFSTIVESSCPEVVYFKVGRQDQTVLNAFRQINNTYYENKGQQTLTDHGVGTVTVRAPK